MVLGSFSVHAAGNTETTIIEIEDFESLTEQSTISDIQTATGLTPVSNCQSSFIGTVNGNKAIKISTAAANNFGHLEVPLGEQVRKDGISIYYSIYTNGDTFSDWSAFHTGSLVSPNGGSAPTILSLQGGNWNSFGNFVSPLADGNGWYNIKVDVYRPDESSDWEVKTYTVINGEETLLGTGIASKTAYPYIESLNLSRIYAISATAHTVYLDNVKVVKYQESFKFTSVSQAEGNISTKLGGIKLTFNREIDESSLSAVTFKNADGTDISGYLSIRAEGNIVKVMFGRLAEGDYVLEVADTLASGDETLGTSLRFEYSAIETPQCYTDYTTDAYTPGMHAASTLNSMVPGIAYTDGGIYTVENYNDIQVLKIQGAGAYSPAGVRYHPAENIESGILSITAEFRVSADLLVRNLFSFITSSNTDLIALQIEREDEGIEVSGNQSAGIPGEVLSQPQKDVNDFYKVRFVVSRKSAEEDWSLNLYDERTGSGTPIYQATVAKEKMPAIKQMGIASLYTMSEAEALQSIMVKNVAVSYESFPHVLDSNAEGLSANADNIYLVLSETVDEEDLDVKITKKDDTDVVIRSDYTYNSNSAEINIDVKSFLEYDTEYVISFGGADLSDYIFRTEATPLKVTSTAIKYNGVVLPQIPSGNFSASYTADFSSGGGTKNVLMLLCAYDENGTIVKIKKETFSFSTETTSHTVTMDNLNGTKVKDIRCYIWEDLLSVYSIISG